MKKLFSIILAAMLMIGVTSPLTNAIEEVKLQPQKQAVNAPKIEIAFVFDSSAEKTNDIVKTYKPIIQKSLLPDYQAVFSNDLIFKGDWTEKGAIAAADKALQSRARMIVCFGYWSGEYLTNKKNKTKNVITVDQYAIRGFSDKFFNPVQQSVNDFVVFQRLVPNLNKTAVLMNERIYKTKNNWQEIANKGLKDKGVNMNIVIVPATDNATETLARIPDDVDSVYATQIYNLSAETRREIYSNLASRKIPTFSSMGKDDVELGALYGSSAKDLDQRLAETVSFNIKNVLKGGSVKSTPVKFVDGNVLFFNKDTAEQIGYVTHTRVLKSVEVISTKQAEVHDLAWVFDTLEKRNLDIKRKKYLVSAARRSVASAYLHYLPTVRFDIGYQTYNKGYAYSYQDVPFHGGAATFGIDQMLYAPDLVTNIIVKHKKLKFDKAEKVLVEQNVGLEVGQLYIDFLMLKNQIAVEKEYIDEVRKNIAIAKTRQLDGKCGPEEILRWTGEISKAEEDLLVMTAAFENLKVSMNKLLYEEQTNDFDLAPLKVTDPAFYLRDINIIDYLRTPEKMEKFNQMLAEEAIYLAPETTKLKAAIGMKRAELANYAQKFVLPNAKLTWEKSKQFDRTLPYYDYLAGTNYPYAPAGMSQLRMMMGDGGTNAFDKDSQRFMIAAQWKPIEGGTKIAEIARCKAELNELHTYLEEVNTEIEEKLRSIVNRAVARYLCIERAYKTKFAQEENYRLVQQRYLEGKADISQVADALQLADQAKLNAANTQYEFFKELIWLQRGLASVNWAKASDEAKNFIQRVKDELEPEGDINVNL